MEDSIKQSSSSENATVYCDCCYRKISSMYYECLACHDFHYCPGSGLQDSDLFLIQLLALSIAQFD